MGLAEIVDRRSCMEQKESWVSCMELGTRSCIEQKQSLAVWSWIKEAALSRKRTALAVFSWIQEGEVRIQLKFSWRLIEEDGARTGSAGTGVRTVLAGVRTH